MSSLNRSISQRFSRNLSSKSTPTITVKTNVATSPITKTAEKEQGILESFRENVKKGSPFGVEYSSIAAILDVLRHKESIDDRKMLLEHLLMFLARMQPGGLATTMTNFTIKLLYNDLPHPPATYIGKEHQWRTADGSFNNPDIPSLGAANTPYARSVQQNHPLPASALPDPGLLFDTLLRRREFKKHPAGLSSLMFAFAALVIHTVFQTSHAEISINETSSYVDLAPLYGDTQEDQDKVRMRDGLGLLFPDVFAEDRLMLLPPPCCVLLVLFNRNHNYIAKKIFEINERKTFKHPSKFSSSDPAKNAKLLAQDEEIFQTARLCNIGWFGFVVFSDYFTSILGLVRQGNSWIMNPFGEIRNEDHTLFERGRGNACSVEFNCLYRWHATTSAEDEEWVEKTFSHLFKGKAPEAVTLDDFKTVAKEIKASQPDIKHWTFGVMERGKDGKFKDAELANYLHNATARPAGTFGARHTPHIMRSHEIMGIEQTRRWGVCTLNDFRKFLGLRPYDSFLEWNSDPEIADTAEKLYGDIHHLELYVGLQAEEIKPVIDGAGLCPGYTISRAILSDAIALTRGDRFFTQDFTPYNMTAWGFQDCQRDPNGPGFGSMLGRLFLRTLPEFFTENSVFTWFPFMTPEAMEENLTKLDLLDKYDLARPKEVPAFKKVTGHSQVAQILADKEGFKPSYAKKAGKVIQGKGFFLASDSAEAPEQHEKVIKALADTPASVLKIEKYFFDTTRELINNASYAPVVGKIKNVNLVRDVLRYVPLHWAATEIAGIPLKTKTQDGAYTESELFDVLGDIYSYIFLEGDAGRSMLIEDKVKKETEKLLSHIKSHIGGTARLSGIVGTLTSAFNKPKKSEHGEILKRLNSLGFSNDQLANSVLAILVGSTVELSIVLTNAVNLLLGSDKDAHIRSLFGDAKNTAQLQGYVYETLRLDPPFKGAFRVAQKDATISSLSIKKGDRLFLDTANANLEESVFPKSSSIDPTRAPKERYLITEGVFKTLGANLASKIVVSVLHAVLGLPNLRRGPGQSGYLPRFLDSADPVIRYGYLDKSQLQVPWPNTFTVQYDTA